MKLEQYKTIAKDKLARLLEAFMPILYEDDEQFLKNMEEQLLLQYLEKL